MTEKLTRREFVKQSATGASAFAAGFSLIDRPSKSTPPNVIFILADDLGWGDLSCYGRPDYKTPNIDRLAQQGIRFTNAYASSALCTPSRCGFLTGRYPVRLSVGLEEPLHADNDRVGLDPNHPTIASLLKRNGYSTALIGKWHLGFRSEWGPNAHGFDYFFGALAGADDYFLHKTGLGQPDLYENLTPVERQGYLTELFTERAVKFVTEHRNNPFYLSLHYTAPHWPWQGPRGGESVQFSKTLPEPVSMGAGGSLKIYAEMMHSLDAGVGRVMHALDIQGLTQNTLVFFTSDNGGERFSYLWPLSGSKGNLGEGGIRVPAIVRWPRVIPAGRTTSQVAINMDWTATILAATSTAPDPGYPLDGRNLLPVLKGSEGAQDRTLFWRVGDEDAVRMGNWKYRRVGNRTFLFDLLADEREQANFREQRPEIFRKLKAEFEKWEQQMLPRKKERAG
jgi:arylsulfatase A-like enzyme